MNDNAQFKRSLKKWLFFILLIPLFMSCENARFDRDKRQIMAKDEIRHKLRHTSAFDINSFKEDTVQGSTASDFKQLIRYTLHITYLDSSGLLQKKKGIVLFTPEGKSIIRSEITDL